MEEPLSKDNIIQLAHCFFLCLLNLSGLGWSICLAFNAISSLTKLQKLSEGDYCTSQPTFSHLAFDLATPTSRGQVLETYIYSQYKKQIWC